MNATGLPCFGFNPGGAKILLDRMLTPLCRRTGWQPDYTTIVSGGSEYSLSVNPLAVALTRTS